MRLVDSILIRTSAVMLCALALSASPKVSALAELFGVPLGLHLENLEGWECYEQGRSSNTRDALCTHSSPPAFGAYTPEFVTLKVHDTKGICVISGIHYLLEEQENVLKYQARVSAPWLFVYDLGAPSLPTTRALQTEKYPKYRVFGGLSTDKLGLEAGGRIMRWSNLGPEKSILQFEAYDVDPKYRPVSEGMFHEAYTNAGVPKDMKVNVLLLTLYSDFWRDCNIA